MTEFKLRALRINNGWKMEQAAEKLGISKNVLTSYEQGRTIPKVDMALKIAELYGVAIGDIVFGADTATIKK